MGLILDGRNYTRFQIQQAIQNYLVTLPDYARWKDMFQSSVGLTMIDLMTGISELLMFKMDNRLREQYLFTAQNKTSVYLIADMLGYGVNRKNPAMGTINIVFDSVLPVPVTITTQQVFGYNPSVMTLISNPEGITIPAGIKNYLTDASSPTPIPVIQGNLSYALLTNTPNTSYTFNGVNIPTISFQGDDFERLIISDNGTFTISDVTDTLTQNQIISFTICSADSNNALTPVTGSKNIQWINEFQSVDSNTVIVRTYYNGGVYIVFGDGTNGYKLNLTDLILVAYVVTEGRGIYIPASTSLGTQVFPVKVMDQYGNLTSASLTGTVVVNTAIYGGSDEDPVAEIKQSLAGWYAAQNRAVTLNDWRYILLAFAGITDAYARKYFEGNMDTAFENYIIAATKSSTNSISLTAGQLQTLYQEAVDSCCTVEVCCLTQNIITEGRPEWSDPTTYWINNNTSLISYLTNYKMISTNVIVTPPKWKHLQINFSITLSNLYPNISSISSTIYSLVVSYIYTLNQTFYPTELIKNIYNSITEVNRIDITSISLASTIDSKGNLIFVPQTQVYKEIILDWGQYLRTSVDSIITTIVIETS